MQQCVLMVAAHDVVELRNFARQSGTPGHLAAQVLPSLTTYGLACDNALLGTKPFTAIDLANLTTAGAFSVPPVR